MCKVLLGCSGNQTFLPKVNFLSLLRFAFWKIEVLYEHHTAIEILFKMWIFCDKNLWNDEESKVLMKKLL